MRETKRKKPILLLVVVGVLLAIVGAIVIPSAYRVLNYETRERYNILSARGLKEEMSGQTDKAIKTYAELVYPQRPDGYRQAFYHEFHGRALFYAGRTTESLAAYRAKTDWVQLESDNFSRLWTKKNNPLMQAKRSIAADMLLTKGESKLYLQECSRMIEDCRSFSTDAKAFYFKENYYDGSAEGFVRKYAALSDLRRDNEAQAIRQAFLKQYARDILGKNTP